MMLMMMNPFPVNVENMVSS